MKSKKFLLIVVAAGALALAAAPRATAGVSVGIGIGFPVGYGYYGYGYPYGNTYVYPSCGYYRYRPYYAPRRVVYVAPRHYNCRHGHVRRVYHRPYLYR